MERLVCCHLQRIQGQSHWKITRLQKLNRDSSDPNVFNPYENMETKTGDWNFEIPVTKQPTVEYALDEKTEVEGIPVRFEN